MKLIASGVANWAAIVKSPSFSRSSSSQTTTILPWRMSSIACSIVAERRGCFEVRSCACLRAVARRAWRDVHLDVDGCPLPAPLQESCARASRGSARPRNRLSPTALTVRLTPSSATEPFSTRYRASCGSTSISSTRAKPSSADRGDAAGAVDVALHDVSAEPVAGAQRELEVDARARAERTERGALRASRSWPPRGSRRRRATVAVRHTPLTAIESPSASCAGEPLSIRSVAPSRRARARSTRAEVGDQPVNTAARSRVALRTSPLPQARGDEQVLADALAARR